MRLAADLRLTPKHKYSDFYHNVENEFFDLTSEYNGRKYMLDLKLNNR